MATAKSATAVERDEVAFVAASASGGTRAPATSQPQSSSSSSTTTSSASSSVLYAASKEIGNACAEQNKAFLRCKAKDEDPHTCLREGEAVQSCVVDVLKQIYVQCPEEFNAFSKCLAEQRATDYAFDRCRRQERAFVRCRGSGGGGGGGEHASVGARE